MLDCYGCSREKLKDAGFIFDFLKSFSDRIKMTRVSEPLVFKYSCENTDWGISGVVLVAESHISIHTFPEKEHAFIDIFSCKEFNLDRAREELLKAFGASFHREELVEQVIGCPDQKPNLAGIIDRERTNLMRSSGGC